MQTQVAQKEIFNDKNEESSIQFLVFKDQKYVRLNGYMQARVTIGSSPEADLILNHRSVASLHADVSFQDGQLLLTNYNPNNGLRVNGRSVEKINLKTRDVIDIGPFSMVLKQDYGQNDGSKVVDGKTGGEKTKKIQIVEREEMLDPDSGSNISVYSIILSNEYTNDVEREQVAQKLGTIFGKPPERIRKMLDRKDRILKDYLTLEKALKLKDILETSGAKCILRSKEIEPTVRRQNEKSNAVVEDDEDDEGDIAASFSMKEKLSILSGSAAQNIQNGQEIRRQLEIVRSINDRVMDVQYIPRGKRYQVFTDSGKLKLANITNSNRGYVTFPDSCKGYLFSNGGKIELNDYKIEKYLYRKRRRLYRLPLAFGESVVVTEGLCEYQIRHTSCSESPQISIKAREKEITWRHWATSTSLHLFLLLAACVAFSISMKTPEKNDLRFVKIDMSQLKTEKAPEIREVKPQPKPKPGPPKIEPAKKEPEVVKPMEQKPAKQRPKAAQSTTKTAASKKTAAPESHPHAGGGFGEGNVQNRNIKQTGLLSLLGDSGTAGPSDVIASVSNIDAVEMPGASGRLFSVGGVKGSLGTGKISISSGEVVKTKGSRQVFRSAGAEGPGTVAALERGETGQKQVKGMVTAKMTRTVSVQGGMSREMVKRVIDQHLEAIQYCYESSLMENPAIMGRIVYEWKILLSGKVGEVRIASSTVNSHQIHDCIKAAIKSWQFPKPVGTEVVVSYPFVFDLVGF